MPRLFLFLPFLTFGTFAFTQTNELATTGTLRSTFNFQTDTLKGTCFVVSYESSSYFFTAAHVFKKGRRSGDVVSILVMVDNAPKTVIAQIYFHPTKGRDVDIAMMKISDRISQGSEGMQIAVSILPIGQDVLFYGFPLASMGTEAFGTKMPLVKKATFSGVLQQGDVSIGVLDGHNNHGFSGGPVLAYDSALKSLAVFAIISGYYPEHGQIQDEKGDVPLFFPENSGIIATYDRRYMREILEKYK